MSIVVFWLEGGDATSYPEARYGRYDDDELMEAMRLCEVKRRDNRCSHVTISSELAGSVGKAGVDQIVDGQTPDGHAYDWRKRRP